MTGSTSIAAPGRLVAVRDARDLARRIERRVRAELDNWNRAAVVCATQEMALSERIGILMRYSRAGTKMGQHSRPPKVTKATVAVVAPVSSRLICSGTLRSVGLPQ